MVEILEPFHGRILDPACGSGGMFVQSARFVAEHKKNPSSELSIFGVEKTDKTGRLARMNLAVHGLEGDIRREDVSGIWRRYWHIGRQIVELLQTGEEWAEYGNRVIEQTAARLRTRYGRGFSTTNLRYFRTFYQVYADRAPEIRQIASGELGPALASVRIPHTPSGVLDDLASAVDQGDCIRGFSPALGWERLRAREPAVHLADVPS